MSPQQLINAIACSSDNAQKFAEALSAAMAKWGIDTPLRQAGFLGQISVESAALSQLSENLNYSTAARLCAVWPSRFKSEAAAQPYVRNPQALANLVYANRMGNGAPESGDGYTFRGRGLKQLTGRDNYTAYGKASGVDAVNQPDLLLQPQYAADSAGWFWQSNACSALADAQDWQGLTKRINGGLTALDQRVAAIKKALQVLEAPA